MFLGDEYVRYFGDMYDYVDDGYFKAIVIGFFSEIGLMEIFDDFKYGIDVILGND